MDKPRLSLAMVEKAMKVRTLKNFNWTLLAVNYYGQKMQARIKENFIISCPDKIILKSKNLSEKMDLIMYNH